MSRRCVDCGKPLTLKDYFEDGITRPHVVLDGDAEPPVTRGPLDLHCFRKAVGLPTAMPDADRRVLATTIREILTLGGEGFYVRLDGNMLTLDGSVALTEEQAAVVKRVIEDD